jgi:hypothetical protein
LFRPQRRPPFIRCACAGNNRWLGRLLKLAHIHAVHRRCFERVYHVVRCESNVVLLGMMSFGVERPRVASAALHHCFIIFPTLPL